MRFVYIQTLIGLLLSASGIQTIYIFVKNLDQGASFLLFVFALFLITSGAVFLLRAGKSDATVFTRMKNVGKPKSNINGLEKALEKNNELTQEWNKTIEKKDKLRMLEISTAVASETD